MNNKLNVELIKQVIEIARKTPQLIKLKAQCVEIGDGKRKQVSKQSIDEAFDSFGIIVKKLVSTPDEENELYKYFWKNWLCSNLKSCGIIISE